MVQDQRPIVRGDFIVALNDMRAWVDDDVRGHGNVYVRRGEQALVLTVRIVGNHQRLRVIRDDRILLFSCAAHAVHKNWSILTVGSPVSGSL